MTTANSSGPVTAKTCASLDRLSTAYAAALSAAKLPSAGCPTTGTWNGAASIFPRKNSTKCRSSIANPGTAKSSATKSSSSSSTTISLRKWSMNENFSSAAYRECLRLRRGDRSGRARLSTKNGLKLPVRERSPYPFDRAKTEMLEPETARDEVENPDCGHNKEQLVELQLRKEAQAVTVENESTDQTG